jgi:sugar/nucleoside kinase (ribokinase family)
VVCALGDLLLDVILRLERPLAAGADVAADTHVGAGGQAANVAAWAAALGAAARFLGKRAADAAGALAEQEVAAHGVEVVGPRVDGRTGVVVSIVARDGERTMASDRGVAPTLSADEVEPAWLAGCEFLHLPAYSLLAEPISDASLRAAELGREAGARLSVDLSAAPAIREFGATRFRELLERLAPDVLFANEDELDALGAEPAAPVWVLKRGARGCVVSHDGARTELDARPAAVVDSTGAGDAFVAGFLVGGAELGLEAAARCLGRLGAMP